MRLARATARAWTFALAERERDFLVAVLRAYPAVPPAYQSLSRESADRLSPDDQQLLNDALAEHRTENRAKVNRWLKGGARFRPVDQEWHFSLSHADYNWMLQTLNDVRVGNWLRLGAPEDVHDPAALVEQDPAAFFLMEAAGMFQMGFLHFGHLPPDPT
jgi:hypothetical protein